MVLSGRWWGSVDGDASDGPRSALHRVFGQQTRDAVDDPQHHRGLLGGQFLEEAPREKNAILYEENFHEDKKAKGWMTITLELVPEDLCARYEVREWRHAAAILVGDFPDEWNDIREVLRGFKLCKSFIDTGGGRKSKVSESIDSAFYARGWTEKSFSTAIVVDGSTSDSPTHAIDCYKNNIKLTTDRKSVV